MDCSLCAERIEMRVILPCNHSDICLGCYVRLVKCYRSTLCHFCQKPISQDPVVVCGPAIPYETARARNPKHLDTFNLFYFDDVVPQFLSRLNIFTCPDCGMTFTALDIFAMHLRTESHSVCCICFDTGRFLPSDAPVFRRNEYHRHLKQHPRCPCCHYVGFDEATLAQHMIERHYRCDICAANNKIVWLKTPELLVAHHEQNHFVCHHPECSTEHLIAFGTKGELLLHLQSVHRERDHAIDLTVDFANRDREAEEEAERARERVRELNRRFVQKLERVFQGNKRKIDDLKKEAQAMITGRIDPAEFYRRFNRICGKRKGSQVFTDMVAILPDPRRRAELLRLHELGGGADEEEDRRERRDRGGRRGRGGRHDIREEPPATGQLQISKVEQKAPEPEPKREEPVPEPAPEQAPAPEPAAPSSRKKRARRTVLVSF